MLLRESYPSQLDTLHPTKILCLDMIVIDMMLAHLLTMG